MVVFSRSVVSDSLLLHGLLHPRLPCPSLSPGVSSNSCPLSRWCSLLILCHSFLILCRSHLFLPLVFPSIRVFSNRLVPNIRWPKYWSFSFSISPSSEHSGLISFRIDLIWSLCCPRDSQESSPASQFKSINSSSRGSLVPLCFLPLGFDGGGVQLLSHVRLFAALWTVECYISLSFTISQSLLKLISIELMMPSNCLILYQSPSPPALKSSPASRSFPMSQLFSSDGQSIGASALSSVLLMNIQGWFPLALTEAGKICHPVIPKWTTSWKMLHLVQEWNTAYSDLNGQVLIL